jgi:hypothetical protein
LINPEMNGTDQLKESWARIGPGGQVREAEMPAQAQVAAWARLPRRLSEQAGRFGAAGPRTVLGRGPLSFWAAHYSAEQRKKKKTRAGPQVNSDRGWAKIETEIDFLFLFFQKLC